MAWIGIHCLFVVKKFFRTGKSVIVTRRHFRAHFMLRQNDAVLDRKMTVLDWLKILSRIASSQRNMK